jgi:hypothetical protein
MNSPIDSTQPRRFCWSRTVAIEVSCITLAAATASELFQISEVLRRTPFGSAELLTLGIAMFGLSVAWGFFGFVADVALFGDLRALHPARLAGWLSGGVWVAASLGAQASLDASTRSYAVFSLLELGTLVAAPLVLALLGMSLRRPERQKADWRAWVGFVSGCTLPAPFLLGAVFLV